MGTNLICALRRTSVFLPVTLAALAAAVIPPPSASAESPPPEVTFVGATSNGSSAGRNTITIARPSGTTTEDLMVAAITVNDDQPNVLTPAGWTLLGTNAIHDRLRLSIYTRVAQASEPATYTWRLAHDFRRLSAGIATYRGTDPVVPIDAHGATVDTSADTSVQAPSITTSVLGTRLLHIAAINAEGALRSPGGMTERFEAISPNTAAPRDAHVSLSDAFRPAVGATGGRTATATVAGVHIGVLLALQGT